MSDIRRLDEKFDLFRQWTHAEHDRLKEEIRGVKDAQKEATTALQSDLSSLERKIEDQNSKITSKLEDLNNFKVRTTAIASVLGTIGGWVAGKFF